MTSIDFGLILNLHQPPGNLDELLDTRAWEAKEILWALDRIPRSLWECEDVGRVHLALSGTLLETLADPRFQERAYGIVDCGSLLWHFQNTRTIDVLGSAYYHPVLPLIPEVRDSKGMVYRGPSGIIINLVLPVNRGRTGSSSSRYNPRLKRIKGNSSIFLMARL